MGYCALILYKQKKKIQTKREANLKTLSKINKWRKEAEEMEIEICCNFNFFCK